MIKYILGLIIVLAIVIVAVTIGANNDQVITFNYIVAESQFDLRKQSQLIQIFQLFRNYTWTRWRICSLQ